MPTRTSRPPLDGVTPRRRTAREELAQRRDDLDWVRETPQRLQQDLNALGLSVEERSELRAEIAALPQTLPAEIAAAEAAVAELETYLAEHGDTWWD